MKETTWKQECNKLLAALREVAFGQYGDEVYAREQAEKALREFSKPNHNDAPLKSTLEDGALVIRIGSETLVFCSREENGGRLKRGRVDGRKAREFAKDIIRGLEKDDDAGNTILNLFLDEAMQLAVDEGSGAIIYERKP